MDIEKEMSNLKLKQNPVQTDVNKLVRYYANVKNMTNEQILEDISHWPLELVQNALSAVEKEKLKPKPKRYYVSLKEPLEDPNLR